jgi:hypothetical protein
VADIEELKQLQMAYNKVFETKEGKLVLEDLQKKCFKNHTTAHELPHMTFFNEGQRVVLLHIETMMIMNLKLGEQTHGQP